MQRLGLVSCLTRLHPLRTEWAQGIADRCGLFTGAYAAESLALPYCFLRNSPGGTDMCSLSQCASERCLWLCKLSQGVHRVLAVQPGGVCLDVGMQPGCGYAWMWGVSCGICCWGAGTPDRGRALCCYSPALWLCPCSTGSSLSPSLSLPLFCFLKHAT